MTGTDPSSSSLTWLAFALMTVVAWGVYGVFIHNGQTQMADPTHGRYKAFLFVGLAYFLVAVVAPMAVLVIGGASWRFTGGGVLWSVVAGLAGAVGAFCVLLAFEAKGSPAVVMSIIFAGAPLVNAVVALSSHPPAGGLGAIRAPFYLGILLAALGGLLVTMYKPAPAAPPPTPPAAARPAGSLPESPGL